MAKTSGLSSQKTLEDAYKALDSVAQALPEREHLAQWEKEIEAGQSHRGAAILLATMVENALDIALVQTLNVSKDRKREIFKSSGIFGTFSAKIVMAHAIRIFGSETRTNLDIIRQIRNAFAHAKIPISFDTIEVKDICKFLRVPGYLIPGQRNVVPQESGFTPTGRELYQLTCNRLAHNISWWYPSMNLAVASSANSAIPPDNCKIVAITTPLP